MERSKDIDQLVGALARAQGKYKTVKRSGKNPKFNSRYATLDDVIVAVRKALSSEALAYTQLVGSDDAGYFLTTILAHETGQFISEVVRIVPDNLVSRQGKKVRNDLQELGNALAYIKRYALASMFGVNSEIDDDGNASGQRTNGKQQAPPPQSEQARAAQEEKAREAEARETVKQELRVEGRASGFLSDPPTNPEWKVFYKALGPVYDTLRKPGVPEGGWDALRDCGIELLRENAPEPEVTQEEVPDPEDPASIDPETAAMERELDDNSPIAPGTAPHYSDN